MWSSTGQKSSQEFWPPQAPLLTIPTVSTPLLFIRVRPGMASPARTSRRPSAVRLLLRLHRRLQLRVLAGAEAVVREEAAVEVVEEVGDRAVRPSACGNSLHTKRVASRPFNRILAIAVRTSRYSLHFLSQPGGSHYTHAALTAFTPEDFLHNSSLPACSARRSPPDLHHSPTDAKL